MEPFANLAWVNYKSNHFTEHGSGSVLSGENQSTSAALSTLGLRADTGWQIGKVHAVTLRGEMG
ncbi:autotransporter domain-containing protein [Serratia bockelmannii]|uniref:autotransporter domain-containing protein n=1 Tax=Serratia bockelmannii TaxID=2703793 RepID=UPI003FA7908C